MLVIIFIRRAKRVLSVSAVLPQAAVANASVIVALLKKTSWAN